MSKPKAVAMSCWDRAAAALGRGRRVILYGPPATGKTHQAMRAGRAANQEVVSITLTEETSAAELRGHYVPVNGHFEWRDGPVIRAWRLGARLVLNEIDHAGADALSFLLVILDDPGFVVLTLPTNETVQPAPGFSAVATMNGDPDGLPAALRDRFPITIRIDEVHPDAIVALPPDLRHAAAATVDLPPERRISLRQWQEFAALREPLSNENAARIVFGPRAGDVLDALTVKA
jgi:MoxR-like ATPase